MKFQSILIVEPDAVLAKSYQKVLESLNFVVYLANSAQDAINQVDKNKIDLIILEIQLIDHSGIEFLYELRSYPEWDNIRIIILSSVPEHEFKDNLAILKNDLKVDHYLYKNSLKLNKLVDIIESLE